MELNENGKPLVNGAGDASRKHTINDIIQKIVDYPSDRIVINDSDSDVVVLPQPSSPKPNFKVEKVNSLKIMDTAETTHEEWLNIIIEKHKKDVANVGSDIFNQIAQKQEIEEACSNPIAIKDSDSDVEVLPQPCSLDPNFKVVKVNNLKSMDTPVKTNEEWLHSIIEKHKKDVANVGPETCNQTVQPQKIGEVCSVIQGQHLEEQMVKCLNIKNTMLPSHIEEIIFPELSADDIFRIDCITRGNPVNPAKVLVSKFNLSITQADFQTLDGLNWLNDQIINFYMNLLIERGQNTKRPKVYAMNTFFFPKLLKDGPYSLRRWTRRVDIFSYDIIVVPIHLRIHWCMSIINFTNCSIKYYDSMGKSNNCCLNALLSYLKYEHLDKKQREYDVSEWILENVQDIPQQMNGSDCGVFSCTYAEFLTRNADLSFSQENMPYLRRKMVLEILNGALLVQ